jgi:large repetitive protein
VTARARVVPLAAGAVTLALAVLAAAPAQAQHAVDFQVERYQPSALPEPYFQVEGGDVLPRHAWSLGVAGSWSWRPLVVRDRKANAELSTPVEQRLGVDVLLGWGLGRFVSLGLAVPVTVLQRGDRVAGIDVNDERGLQALAAGDPRLELKALMGRPQGFRPRGAFSLTVSLPLGASDEFSGEAGVVIEPRVVVDLVRPRWAVAVNVGARLRTVEAQFFDEPIRNELWAGLGARTSATLLGARQSGLGSRIWLTGEVVTVLASEGGPTPFELRGGVRVAWAHRVDVGFGIGVGMNQEVGAPAFRGMFDVRWGGAPRDSDRDGIGDVCDPCVYDAEDIDGFQDSDGCPELDNDQDGVDDSEDACPMQAEDVDGWQDADGCPDNDNDSDGIADSLDGCPNVAEPKDGVDDADGCPP